MAKKDEQAHVPAVQDERTVAGPITWSPAEIIDDSLEVAKITGLPAEFAGGSFMSGFPPTVKFSKPGDAIGGEFIHMRTDVGPNHSRVYELAISDGNGGNLNVVVWGATALDRQFDSAYPPIQQGDKLVIMYLGDKPTKRKQNPVRLYAVKVIR